MTRSPQPGFVARGGPWVLAQLPLMFVVFVLPPWLGAGALVPRQPLALAGAAAVAFGAGLTFWGVASLGEALTPYPRPLPDATLRRRGAYRWMRHPVYSGVVLAGLGWALWWTSATGAWGTLALAIFYDRKAAYEETWLRKKYSDYGDYARRVKKFIPGVY